MALIRNIWLTMKEILRLTQQRINEELKPLDLSSSEGDILFLLLTNKDKLHQEQLAELLDIGKAAISRAVASLESKGYIKRMREPDDKRAYNVYLTDKALAVSNKIEAAYHRLYEAAKMNITAEEAHNLETLLEKIAANIQISPE